MVAKKQDGPNTHDPHVGRSLTLHRLIEKLVQRGWRHDPAWQKQWREAVSEYKGRFRYFLNRYPLNEQAQILDAIQPERRHWIRLLNLDTKSGDNVTKYVLDPAKYKEDGPAKEGFEGLSFKQVSDISQILEKFGYLKHLPIFEDKESWTRVLSEALEKVTFELDEGSSADDHWLPASNVKIIIPPCFIGRDDTLAEIDDVLARDQNRVVIAAIHGLSGVGKTMVAAAYATDHRNDYRATWWVNAATPEAMQTGLVSLGVRLRWVPSDMGQEVAFPRVIERLADTADDILLIFDNALDPDAIAPYLPKAGRCRILVTTNSDVWRKHAIFIHLTPWAKEAAAQFLVARTGETELLKDAEMLTEEFGGLPLALEMAAAYCENEGIGLAEFHRRYGAKKLEFLAKEKYAPTEYKGGVPVVATFNLAIEAAAKVHSAAKSLLICCALLAPEPVPLYIFSEVHDVYGAPLGTAIAAGQLDDIVTALRKFALVARERAADGDNPSVVTHVLRLHRLVSDIAVARRDDAQLQQLRREIFVGVFRTFPSDADINLKSWPRCAQLAVHAAILRDIAPRTFSNAEEWGELLTRLGHYFHGAGAFNAAERVFRDVVAVEEAALGETHIALASAYNNLAGTLRQKASYAEAYELMERVRAIGEPVWGPEHPSLVVTVEALGNLLTQLDRLQEALPMLRRALEMSERINGPDDFATGRCAGSLAGLLQQINDDGKAMQLYQRQEAIIRTTTGPASVALAVCHNNIGNIYLKNKMYLGARYRLERSLQAFEESVGEVHPELIPCLQNLGVVFVNENNFADAEILFIRAQILASQYYGLTHIHTARALENLSRLSYERGDADWRQKTLLVLKLFESNLGADHWETVRMRQVRKAMLMRWHLGRIIKVGVLMVLTAVILWGLFVRR
jgi:tetratricopeptide (TPR) repeat protein